jgi:hypothetical protein
MFAVDARVSENVKEVHRLFVLRADSRSAGGMQPYEITTRRITISASVAKE